MQQIKTQKYKNLRIIQVLDHKIFCKRLPSKAAIPILPTTPIFK